MRVIDSRPSKYGVYFAIRRRRKCEDCSARITTFETDPSVAGVMTKLTMRNKTAIMRRKIDAAITEATEWLSEGMQQKLDRPKCGRCKSRKKVRPYSHKRSQWECAACDHVFTYRQKTNNGT